MERHVLRSTRWLVVTLNVAVAVAALAVPSSSDVISLQNPHASLSPADVMASIGQECEALGVHSFDVYGDFALDSQDSYLRSFEEEVARELGMEDAVFMPSGVMAQSIALLIHSRRHPTTSARKLCFACHHSSHLILHEEDGYRELLNMEPLIISTKEMLSSNNGYSVPPLTFSDVKAAFDNNVAFEGRVGDSVSTLILELPHRELGGKLTPWDDVLQIRNLCVEEGVKFHCDGARVFEASAGYELGLAEMCKPFDSVYISFYKGLGALSGAMLLGNEAFCSEARTWLRRFGGNLYTLLPYAVSSWSGFKKHVLGVDNKMTFKDKQGKMIRLVSLISEINNIQQVLSFDPQVPQTNMVHGYLRASVQDCLEARDEVEQRTGIRVLNRIREIDEADTSFKNGYRAKFEWTMGESNGSVDDEIFLRGWKEFAMVLVRDSVT